MNKELDPQIQKSEVEIAMSKHYKFLVVDPYAVNLIDNGSRKGQARLSFYSAFNINTASEIHSAGIADKVVVYSDASLGEKKASTGELMEEYLFKRSVNPTDVLTLSDPQLNNTASQVKRLKLVLAMENVAGEEVLYLSWNYHKKRLQNHLRGYGINATVIRTDEAHKYFRSEFDQEKLSSLLPNAEIEKTETVKRIVSTIDKKGIIPLAIRWFQKEIQRKEKPFTLDNQRGLDGKLHFIYKPGSQRLKEVESE